MGHARAWTESVVNDTNDTKAVRGPLNSSAARAEVSRKVLCVTTSVNFVHDVFPEPRFRVYFLDISKVALLDFRFPCKNSSSSDCSSPQTSQRTTRARVTEHTFRQCCNDGPLWEVHGKYTVKSRYLRHHKQHDQTHLPLRICQGVRDARGTVTTVCAPLTTPALHGC